MSNEHLEITDKWLERLVDGELSEKEYRGLLTALDAQADGWRRCATAFLEAQAIGQELRSVRHELATAASPNLIGNDSRAKAAWVPLILSVAASFLVAFGLGVWWRNAVSHGSAAIDPTATAAHGVADESNVPSPFESPPSGRSDATSIPAELVTLVVDRSDGGQERFELPVYDADDAIARQWLDRQPTVPSQLENLLRRSGFEVQMQREWTPLDLDDGRRVLFPVDQLEITPVKELTFQ